MPLKLPKRIKTERILLEGAYPPTFVLATEIFKKAFPSYDTLRQWLPWPDKIKSPEDEYKWLIHWVQKHWEEGSGFAYVIRNRATKDFCGVVDLFRYDDKNKVAEIGYWLINEAVGHGYITEAVRTLEQKAFESGVNRLQIRNDTRNVRSASVARRCGYHLDGIIRAAAWADYFQDYRDENMWSKLKSEWETERK